MVAISPIMSFVEKFQPSVFAMYCELGTLLADW